jgi:hypothetical protein
MSVGGPTVLQQDISATPAITSTLTSRRITSPFDVSLINHRILTRSSNRGVVYAEGKAVCIGSLVKVTIV